MPLATMRFPALALAKAPSPVPAMASRTDLPPKEQHLALSARMSQRESPPRFLHLQKPVPLAFREVHRLLPVPERSGSRVPGPQARPQSLRCETSITSNLGSSRLVGPWLTVGGWGGHLLSARFLNGLRSGLIELPKQKSHRQVYSGGGILELLAMILEYLAPGARRRTHTAGTTEASLLGLLDDGNHGIRVLKPGSEVNAAIARTGRD